MNMKTMITDKLGTLLPEDYKNKIDLLCTRIIEHYEDGKNFRSGMMEVMFNDAGKFSVWRRSKPILFYKKDTDKPELLIEYYYSVTELHNEIFYFYIDYNLVTMCTRDFDDKDFIFNISVTYSTDIICSMYMMMMLLNIHHGNMLLDRDYMSAFLRSDNE